MWMMRQAGRYMGIYKELCKRHPTFRHAPALRMPLTQALQSHA